MSQGQDFLKANTLEQDKYLFECLCDGQSCFRLFKAFDLMYLELSRRLHNTLTGSVLQPFPFMSLYKHSVDSVNVFKRKKR